MKKIYHPVLIALTAVIFSCSYGQTADYVWAKGSGWTYADDNPQKMVRDGFGNLYVTGYFNGDSTILGSDTLYNPSASVAVSFLAKYDMNGNLLWEKSASSFSVWAYDVATDNSGNVYISGRFSGDSLQLGTDTLLINQWGTGGTDYFLAKWDSSGHLLWARCDTATQNTFGSSVTTDNNGNVIIAGGFIFDDLTFGTTTLEGRGHNSVFITKFDGGGNVLWAKAGVGSMSNIVPLTFLETDSVGNIYVSGTFEGDTLSFDAVNLINADTTRRTQDIFLAKYDPNGNVLWAKRAGGKKDEYNAGLAVDPIGNAYITGSFTSPLIAFGNDTLPLIDSTGEIYVAKYDASGNALWAKSGEGDGVNGIAVTGPDNFCLAGWIYAGSGTFGTFSTPNPAPGYSSLLITGCDASGNVLWTETASGQGDAGKSVAGGTGNNIYMVGGYYNDTLDCGNLHVSGPHDIVLAEISFTTGIRETKAQAQMVLYPNPASNLLHISTAGYEASGYQIYNMLGEMVLARQISGQYFDINLSALASGLYIIQLNSINGQVTSRFVKE